MKAVEFTRGCLKNNKADTTSVQTINKNKKQILNKFDANNQVSSRVLKSLKILSYLRLKAALATQNLISNLNQYIHG